ncbi:MAG TPA: Rv2993c-like domain-containing protein, partial [Microbacterium sp.]|uniref:DUF2437 domain-containing protein n=1 Tax=Microbacterium sp. TaxID=51671 RepID=UPI002D1DE04E
MKIARYLLANETRVGVVDGDRIHPFPEGTTINVVVELGLEGLLDTGAQALRTSPAVPLADVTLVSPVEPRLLRDFTTFEQHVEGMMKFSGHSGIVDAFYEFPPFYTATPHVTTGPGA